ncbi:hypothetical protein MBOL_00500 [Mycobacteroides abscessus subsp. bolletii BD]|nr:hypothetical protein MBOL_00500 [Mycobacteroides abscessus subsp. bolletii BD]
MESGCQTGQAAGVALGDSRSDEISECLGYASGVLFKICA